MDLYENNKYNLIISDKLFKYDGGSNLFIEMCTHLKNPLLVEISYKNYKGKLKYLTFIYNDTLIKRLRKLSLFSFFLLNIYKIYFIKLITNEIIKKFSNYSIERVIVSSNDIQPLIGVAIKKNLGCELHISCHDVPHTYKYSKLDALIIKSWMPGWLEEVDSMDLVSTPMQDYFFGINKNICNKNLFITYSSAGIKTVENFNGKLIFKSNEFVFVGSVRFARELDIFIKSLKIIFETHHINYTLSVFSKSFPIKSKFLSMHSYIFDQNKLLTSLSNFSFGYCPLSFNESDRLLVETSFPGKVATYLASGLPIFLHGPKYSALAKFIEKYEIGVCCNSEDPNEIADFLKAYCDDLNLINMHRTNCKSICNDFFSPNTRKIFFERLSFCNDV